MENLHYGTLPRTLITSLSFSGFRKATICLTYVDLGYVSLQVCHPFDIKADFGYLDYKSTD
jgi:hypothetical protein